VSEPSSEGPSRAAVIGTGLMGGSIGLALRAAGWWVTGIDSDPTRVEAARALGAVDAVGEPSGPVDVTFVATPVGAIPAAVRYALDFSRWVTDVGSVKAPLVAEIADPRFVGGHPMAGSEQEGVEGASATLFTGATWVLTPVESTDPDAYATVRSSVSSLGADVIAVSPDAHDELVAVVSHVPHLAAATLMALASEGADEHRALLRLAAGGFRDMTRIAAGNPAIWPDICAANRTAIGAVLDRLLDALTTTRDLVAAGDRDGLLDTLERARAARRSLPVAGPATGELAVVRVPVPDRPGVLADVTTLATDLGVNIVDLEIAHSSEGPAGVLILVVEESATERFTGGLLARGYRPSVTSLR
jgi:prephenate dehydrogenase